MFTPHEREQEMNALVDAATSVLADLGISASREPARGLDGPTDVFLTLDAGDRGRARYFTAIRLGRLDRQRATAMVLPQERPLLLVSPHVPDSVAEALRARGVDYVDAAGNARLAWSGLLVDVRGRRPHQAPAPRSDPAASRAFTRSGSMVVFALLAWPEMSARPVREIATVTGTAVGTVHGVLGALAAAGYLYPSDDGLRLNRGGELLDRWAEAYAVSLAPKIRLGSFVIDDAARLGELEAALLENGAQLGGELAGSRIDPHLQPATATFYVERIPADLVARFRLRRDDENGIVHFRHRFWQRQEPTGTLVPAPLVFADLVSSGDPRQREHAERMRTIDDRLVELDRS